MFRPICIPKDAPILFMKNMSTPPSIELIISFTIFNIDILNIAPIITIPIMQEIMMPMLFKSKVIPP